jgi:hypothetical protein
MLFRDYQTPCETNPDYDGEGRYTLWPAHSGLRPIADGRQEGGRLPAGYGEMEQR